MAIQYDTFFPVMLNGNNHCDRVCLITVCRVAERLNFNRRIVSQSCGSIVPAIHVNLSAAHISSFIFLSVVISMITVTIHLLFYSRRYGNRYCCFSSLLQLQSRFTVAISGLLLAITCFQCTVGFMLPTRVCDLPSSSQRALSSSTDL
jgi:hypothetical protein